MDRIETRNEIIERTGRFFHFMENQSSETQHWFYTNERKSLIDTRNYHLKVNKSHLFLNDDYVMCLSTLL